MLLAPAEEIPLVGRPAELPFTNASAGFHREGEEWLVPFILKASAQPTEVAVGQSVQFRVEIQARGKVRQPPEKIDLKEVPAFTRLFDIEDFAEDAPRTKGNSWVWEYRLKPKDLNANQIPGMPFLFYNPDVRPSAKAFQMIYSDPVSLTIRPRQTPQLLGDVPAELLSPIFDERLLANERPWTFPNWLFAIPVLGCLLWYLVWRRLYPDALALARRQQSRAARRALAGLRRVGLGKQQQTGEEIFRSLMQYLHERLAFTIAEPTAQQCADTLRDAGCSGDAIQAIGELIAGCAELRFGMNQEMENRLVQKRWQEKAIALIQLVEKELSV
jgi:hypothetical protein